MKKISESSFELEGPASPSRRLSVVGWLKIDSDHIYVMLTISLDDVLKGCSDIMDGRRSRYRACGFAIELQPGFGVRLQRRSMQRFLQFF